MTFLKAADAVYLSHTWSFAYYQALSHRQAFWENYLAKPSHAVMHACSDWDLTKVHRLNDKLLVTSLVKKRMQVFRSLWTAVHQDAFLFPRGPPATSPLYSLFSILPSRLHFGIMKFEDVCEWMFGLYKGNFFLIPFPSRLAEEYRFVLSIGGEALQENPWEALKTLERVPITRKTLTDSNIIPLLKAARSHEDDEGGFGMCISVVCGIERKNDVLLRLGE